MSIWTKRIASPQTDDKVKAAGRFGGKLALVATGIVALAVWTYIVRGIHDYCYAMSAWSDGASKRGPDDWTPYVILWIVPLLLASLVGLMIRASLAKNKNG